MYIIYVLHLIEYYLQAAWDFKPTDLFVITLTVPLSVSLQYLFTLETIWRAHHLWLSSRKMVLTVVFPSGSSDSSESGASKCWISRSTAKLPIDQKFFSQPFWLPSWLVLFALVSLCFVHKQQSYWRWHQTNCIVAVSSVSVTEGTSGRTSSSCLLLSMGQQHRSKNIKSMIVFFHLIISKPRISKSWPVYNL